MGDRRGDARRGRLYELALSAGEGWVRVLYSSEYNEIPISSSSVIGLQFGEIILPVSLNEIDAHPPPQASAKLQSLHFSIDVTSLSSHCSTKSSFSDTSG